MKPRVFLSRVLCGLAAVTLVVACTRNTPANTSGPTPVAIQLNWFPDAEHAYIYYGIQQGVFSKAGFNLSVTPGRGSELSAKAVAAGNVDFALVSPDALLAIAVQGANVHSLGAVLRSNPTVIYSPSNHPLTRPQDLVGKRIGVLLGSNTYPQYQGWAAIVGLNLSRVTEVPVDGRSAPMLLNEGKIDALPYYDHYVSAFEVQFKRSYARIYLQPVLPMYGIVLVANDEHMSALGPQAETRFVEAIRQSLRLTAANPDAAIDALAKVSGGQIDHSSKLAELKTFLSKTCMRPDCSDALAQDDAGWRQTADTVQKLGIIASPSVYTKVFGGRR